MTKSLHAGRTAQSGVLAARLAKAGYDASPDVLESIVEQSRARSAVYDVITNGVPVSIEVEAS